MTKFLIIWVGQLVSLVGSGITRFALVIWAWEKTGLATTLALVGFASFAPTILMSPIAGALVDRWNRRLTLMISDLLSGVATFGMLVLLVGGRLEIWHLYVVGVVAGIGDSFQWPAYSATIPLMLRKEQYIRANSLLEVARSGANIAAPVLAGVLLGVIDFDGILRLDLATFGIAVVTLLIVAIPSPQRSEESAGQKASLMQDAVFGFRFIWERPSLLALQGLYFVSNLIGTMGFTVVPAMILARTGNDEVVLGSVQSVGGIGSLIGGLGLTAWGGPKKRILGVLYGLVFIYIGVLFLGLGREVTAWSIGMFLVLLFLTVLNGSSQAIWQAKVDPKLQGRVFATRRLIAQVTVPFGMLISGPLADSVFEPMLSSAAAVPAFIDTLFGRGPGAGMALMLTLSALVGFAVAAAGFAHKPIRDVEELIPDHALAETAS